jgi:hypothetical protein
MVALSAVISQSSIWEVGEYIYDGLQQKNKR